MSTHKHIDRLCAAVLACTLVLAQLFLNGEALGVQAAKLIAAQVIQKPDCVLGLRRGGVRGPAFRHRKGPHRRHRHGRLGGVSRNL